MKSSRVSKCINLEEKNTWAQVLEKMKLIETRLQDISDNVDEQEKVEDLQHRRDTKTIVRRAVKKSQPRNLSLADRILLSRANKTAAAGQEFEDDRRPSSVPPPVSLRMAESTASLMSAPAGTSAEDEYGLPLVEFVGSPRYSKEELRILKSISTTDSERESNPKLTECEKSDSPSGLNTEQLDRLIEGDFDKELDKIIKEKDK